MQAPSIIFQTLIIQSRFPLAMIISFILTKHSITLLLPEITLQFPDKILQVVIDVEMPAAIVKSLIFIRHLQNDIK